MSHSHALKVTVDAMYVDIPAGMQPATENLVRDGRRSFSSSATGLSAGDQGVVARVQATMSW